jgi:hypothetical protein
MDAVDGTGRVCPDIPVRSRNSAHSNRTAPLDGWGRRLPLGAVPPVRSAACAVTRAAASAGHKSSSVGASLDLKQLLKVGQLLER